MTHVEAVKLLLHAIDPNPTAHPELAEALDRVLGGALTGSHAGPDAKTTKHLATLGDGVEALVADATELRKELGKALDRIAELEHALQVVGKKK